MEEETLPSHFQSHLVTIVTTTTTKTWIVALLNEKRWTHCNFWKNGNYFHFIFATLMKHLLFSWNSNLSIWITELTLLWSNNLYLNANVFLNLALTATEEKMFYIKESSQLLFPSNFSKEKLNSFSNTRNPSITINWPKTKTEGWQSILITVDCVP